MARIYGELAQAHERARNRKADLADELLNACKLALAEIGRLYTGQPTENYEDNPVVKRLRWVIAKTETPARPGVCKPGRR